MKIIFFLFFALYFNSGFAQADTTIIGKNVITLSEVVVRNNLNVPTLISRIKNDTSFYKAFKNLHIVGYTAINDIRMLNKKGNPDAIYKSKTRQIRQGDCRIMETLEQESSGDFFTKDGSYNYYTANMYASLFFTKGKICGENNIVKDLDFSTSDKKGIEKNKEQLKMLFFNPGRRIRGIPFMSRKTEIFSDDLADEYDMDVDYETFNNIPCYVFKQKVKAGRESKVVINEMTTWFNDKTFEIVGRSYNLSYDAGVYDFNVEMEVVMTTFNGLTIPELIRYNGNWKVFGKKRERGVFNATLSDFN